LSFDQSVVAMAGATKAANTRQREAVTVSQFFPPLHPKAINPTTTTHGHIVLSPVLLAPRDQDGNPLNSMIDIYDLTEKLETEQSNYCFLLTFSLNFVLFT